MCLIKGVTRFTDLQTRRLTKVPRVFSTTGAVRFYPVQIWIALPDETSRDFRFP